MHVRRMFCGKRTIFYAEYFHHPIMKKTFLIYFSFDVWNGPWIFPCIICGYLFCVSNLQFFSMIDWIVRHSALECLFWLWEPDNFRLVHVYIYRKTPKMRNTISHTPGGNTTKKASGNWNHNALTMFSSCLICSVAAKHKTPRISVA